MKSQLVNGLPQKFRKYLKLAAGLFSIWFFMIAMEMSQQYIPLAGKIIEHAREEGLRVSALFYTDEPSTAQSEEWCRQHFHED